jgi:asparagine synthase (glutamine-hydrolysing)
LDASEKGDVLLLPPGYMLTKKTCSRYRTALGGPFSGSEPGDVRTLDHLMFDAVKSRLPDGLPVAVQLSGGIDSTLVAHYARQSRTHVPCYFLGNPGAPDYRYVVEYAELSGADLRILPFDPAAPTMRSEIDHAIAVSESFEPTVVRGAVCSNRVAEAMHLDGFRVALAGEGADELFAGYIPLEEGFLHSNAAGRGLRAECLDMMHRTCLQRIDRSGMRYELEVREPFLDPRIAAYALELAPSALVGPVGGHIRGKKALRDLYDLYSEQLPRSIRDRSKVPFGEGAGMDANRNEAVWLGYFEDAISNRDFRDGQKEFAAYEIISKEELYYLRKLAAVMDISRIPHLRGRVKLSALPDSDVPQQIAVA